MQNQMACEVSKVDVCLREGVCGVRRYEYYFILLQFPPGDLDVIGISAEKGKRTELYCLSDHVSRSARINLEVAYREENSLCL